MKKRVCLLLLAVSVLVWGTSLFAGGGGDKSSGGSAGSGVTKIRVWSDNASEKTVRDAQVARFNAGEGKAKGIEIEYTVYGTNFAEAIDIALKAGEAPELFRQDGKVFTNYVGAEVVLPLSDLPGGQALVDKYKGQLIPNLHTWNGKAYTLPYNVTTYKFVINKDLFDAAGITKLPTTWEEVRQAAKTITTKGAGQYYGFVLGLQSPWTITTYFLFPNGANTGLAVFDNEKLQYNFSAHLPWVSSVVGMINDRSVFPGYENLDADQMRAQFAAGRVAMIPGASFDVGVYTDQFPANFNWVVIDVPAFTASGAPYKAIVSATNLLAVSTTAKKNPEKTMEVLNFFYSDENMAEMYEAGLYIPFRSEAVALAKKAPTARGFAEFADVPQKIILLPSPDTETAVEGLVYRDALIRLFSRPTDAAAVLQELDTRYNAALKKNVDSATLNGFKADAARVVRKE
ncbi:ABC transporter substrate-binding protein [Spirochaetia bacterium]|nr:ABC transporter substrate-binding protein [Spirochaetia bacterium]